MNPLTVKIFQNTLRMLEVRGYHTSMLDETEKISKNNEFITSKDIDLENRDYFNPEKYYKKDISDYEDMFKMSYCVIDDVNKRENYIIFIIANKAGSDIILDIIDNTQKQRQDYVKYYDIVVPKDFKSNIKNKMDEIEKIFELRIYESRYFMALPGHMLGSEYEKMEREDAIKMMADFEINPKQMKMISRNENIIKYFGFSKGDVLRVYRRPVIAGSIVKKILDYRLVV